MACRCGRAGLPKSTSPGATSLMMPDWAAILAPSPTVRWPLMPAYATAPWQMTLAAYLTMIVADMARMVATIINYRRRHG